MNLIGPIQGPPRGAQTFKGSKNSNPLTRIHTGRLKALNGTDYHTKIVDEFAVKLPKKMELAKRPQAEIKETIMRKTVLKDFFQFNNRLAYMKRAIAKFFK